MYQNINIVKNALPRQYININISSRRVDPGMVAVSAGIKHLFVTHTKE
jgi:hypothetical protein